MSQIQDDIIVSCIGSLGRWQIIMIVLISLTRVSIPWHQMGIVFLAPKTEFTCSNNSIEQCSPECPSHDFNRSIFQESIITEWDLVCENSYSNFIQALIMIGNFVGSLLFGYFSDKFGRKIIFISVILLELVAGVGAAFSPVIWLFLVLKFLSSLAIGGIGIVSFVLIIEMIGQSHRSSVGTLSQIPFTIGTISLALLGYLLRQWRYFQFSISIPSIIFISYYWIISESARWLLTKGKIDKSIKIMQKAAKYNRLPTSNIEEKVKTYLTTVNDEPNETGNFLDLVKTFEMRLITVCNCLAFFFTQVVIFGATQYMGQIRDNPFVNIALSGALEIPGAFACIYFMNKYGRKWTSIIVSFLGGVCILLIIAVSNFPWAVTILGAIGTMLPGSNIKMNNIYLVELYPTVIRSLGIGVCSSCGKLGSIVASFIVGLDAIQWWLPPAIFGFSAIFVSACYVWLPETLHQQLPNTVQEAIEIRKKQKDFTQSIS